MHFRPTTTPNSIRRSTRALLGGALLFLASQAAAQPSPDYAPILRAPVFNVLDYGATVNDETDDTDAVRAALEACKAAGGGTVYFPAGEYRLAPKDEKDYAFTLTFGNLTIEGDGADKTLLSFYAWGMQDPEGPVLKRGGAFRTKIKHWESIDGITFRGFRATGNASPNKDAGKWIGEISRTGWDITHKGLGIWGRVTNVVVEDSVWDHWRGEIIYAGGGLELGDFTVRRTVVHNSNASAISMGGNVLVEDTEIFDVYNGTECLSMGGNQRLVVRNSVIEPNRNFPEDMKIGKFGVVYLGYRESSLVVENCLIGETQSGAVFLSEFAHNVRIANNTFEDTIGVYGIHLGMYKDLLPDEVLRYQRGWSEFEIVDNVFHARRKSVGEGIAFYTPPGENWRILRNHVKGSDGFSYKSFIRTAGATGEYLLQDNLIEDCDPIAGPYNGPRPVWINNTVTGTRATGTRLANYKGPEDLSPIVLEPTWPRILVNDLADGVASREVMVNPAVLPFLPEGFELEIRRAGNRDRFEGLEFRPDPRWNTLERGYLVYRGSVLRLRVNADGLFELVSYLPGETEVLTLTDTMPNYRRYLGEISLYGQREVHLSPAVAHTFDTFTGVAEGDTVTLHYNALTTIAHVPGVIEVSSGRNFVPGEAGSVTVTRRDGVLLLNDGPRRDPQPPLAGSATISTPYHTAIEFELPVSDPDGLPLTVALAQPLLGGTLELDSPPKVIYRPAPGFMGAEDIVFTVSNGAGEATGSITLRVEAPPATLDSDGDGVPDWLELVFGSDPHDATCRLGMRTAYNAERAVIEVTLPAIRNDALPFLLESSPDLRNWTTRESFNTSSLETIGLEEICLEIPNDPDNASMMFFRLRPATVE
jgi:hypothetical protein